jgi:predicted esterase
MNKKLLVWLHGFGFDKNENSEFTAALAKEYDAKLLGLDAPLPSGRARGGYGWFPALRNSAGELYFLTDGIDDSAKYIIDTINEKKVDWNNVILAGRSQGGLMALYIALTGKAHPGEILVFSSGMFIDVPIVNKNVKITWIEAANDTLLPEKDKKSYKDLQAKGIKVNYILNENSDHDNLNISILKQLKQR